MDVRSKIINLIAHEACVHETEFDEKSSLGGNELRMDELDQVELVMALEEEFNISIPDEDAEQYIGFDNTVKDVIEYIGRKIK